MRQVMPNGSATSSPNCSYNRPSLRSSRANSIRRKNAPPWGSVEYWSERTMLAPDSNRKRDTALTIPGLSGHEISSRIRTARSASSMNLVPDAGSLCGVIDRWLVPQRRVSCSSAHRESVRRVVVAWVPELDPRGALIGHTVRVTDQLDEGAERSLEVIDRLAGGGAARDRERPQ